MKLQDQIVLVTGGARGLGRSIVKALHREGARVAINYLTSQRQAQELRDSLGDRVCIAQADVTDPRSVERMVREAESHFGGRITGVVNNALASFQFNGDDRPKIDNIQWSNFDQQMRGAHAGSLNTVQATLPGMRALNLGASSISAPIFSRILSRPIMTTSHPKPRCCLLPARQRMSSDPMASPSIWCRVDC